MKRVFEIIIGIICVLAVVCGETFDGLDLWLMVASVVCFYRGTPMEFFNLFIGVEDDGTRENI